MRFMVFPEFPPGSAEAHAHVSTLAAAFLLWPEDSGSRDGYCAHQGTIAAGLLRDRFRSDIDGEVHPKEIHDLLVATAPWEVQRFHQSLISPFDGQFSISHILEGLDGNLSAQMAEAERSAFWAGMVLGVVHQMYVHHNTELNGGASVTKAIALLEDIGGPAGSNLRKYWSNHKAVAHLAQAAITVQVCFARDGILPEEELDDWTIFGTVLQHTADVLHLARFFQEFGLGFVPKASSTGPLLNPETIWRMPVSIPYTADLFRIAPLRPDEFELVQNRQTVPGS